jgi:hypothetical protein
MLWELGACNPSLSDTKPRENRFQQIVGGDLTGDQPQLEQGFPNVGRQKLPTNAQIQGGRNPIQRLIGFFQSLVMTNVAYQSSIGFLS